MAHFARVEDGTVVETIVVADSDCAGGDFPGSEEPGREFISVQLGKTGEWFQTSYNGNFRGMYGEPGRSFDGVEFWWPTDWGVPR